MASVAAPVDNGMLPKISGMLPKISGSSVSLIVWVGGFLVFFISLILQVFTIQHGTSGQLSIDTGMNTGIGVGILILLISLVGFLFWSNYNSSKNYNVYLFFAVFISYLMSNIALLLSTTQVTVSTN
jgi:hypothetical protein